MHEREASTRISGLHVVVVGAADGGAVSALLLARAGARVTVFERVARPRAVGAGIALAENGLAVLDSLGLGPAIHEVSLPVSGIRIVDASGRALFTPPTPAPALRMLRRSQLQSVLLDALAAEPLVECHFGVEVASVSSDGEVSATCASGPSRHRADLVIAADGAHSTVRAMGPFGARVRRSGIHYLRALVDAGPATSVEAWTPAGLFGSFAVPGGTYLYASAGTAPCRRSIDGRDVRSLRAAWAAAYAPSAPLLDAVARWEDLLVNEVVIVDCARWAHGRVALVGDAAHAMPPNLGQGANSAMVDGAVLLDELRRRDGVEAALAAYEARRRPAVRRVVRTAAWLGRLAETTNPLGRVVRDRALMPAVQRLTRPADLGAVMQESAETLRAIGRA